MCGFVGVIQQSGDAEEVITEMTDAIAHRGPDDESYYVDERLALGFRRLSIIDLEGGRQPMGNEDDSIVIVFNGEIYNFPELRTELIKRGHTFRTASDTEVIIHGYEEYGEAVLDRLRGMFAFAIYDRRKGRVFGARDHFGQKPYYYALKPGLFMFGSEIKSLLCHPQFEREVNTAALKPYLTFQSSVLDETFFKGVYRVRPGHCFVYDVRSGSLDIRAYYRASLAPTSQELESLVDRIDDVVTESIDSHIISDVPVGAYLSGGVDSSYVVSYLKPDKTFSVGFDFEGFDEAGHARALSEILHVESISTLIDSDDFFSRIGRVQYHSDEPNANLSSVPLHFLSELAARHVKVVLSGEGADELFGGYPSYHEDRALLAYRRYVPRPVRQMLRALVRRLPSFKGRNFLIKGGGTIEDYYVGNAFIFDNEEADAVLAPECRSTITFQSITKPFFDEVAQQDDVTKMQFLDMHFWLPNDILLKADKMSMANSLELRVPMLDRDVFELARTIPSEHKISHGTTKYAMRLAAARHIPGEWASRPKKSFPVPILNWLREERYYRLVREAFEADYVARFFDQARILRLLEEHYSGKRNHSRKIWTVYVFLIWYQEFFLDPDAA